MITQLLLVVLGVLAGFIGTLLGIGGGSIVSPTLIALGYEPHYAVSSSLAAVVGTGVGGLYQLYKHHLVRVKLALLLEAATALGAYVGSLIAVRLRGWQVSLIVSLALAIAGTIVLLSSRLEAKRGLTAGRIAVTLPLCLAAGALSALAGIGGGVVKVPILIGILGLEVKTALATSKLMVLVTAATGLASYVIHGVFSLATALPLAVGSYIGATMSARVLLKLRRRSLRLIAALLYYAMSMVAGLKTVCGV